MQAKEHAEVITTLETRIQDARHKLQGTNTVIIIIAYRP